MIRWLRRLLLVVIFAAAWALWWISPEQPIKEWDVSCCWLTGTSLAASGETALYVDDSGNIPPADRERIPYDRIRLLNLNDGRQLLPDEFATEYLPLDDLRLVAIFRKDRRIDVFDTADGRKTRSISPRRTVGYADVMSTYGGSGLLVKTGDNFDVFDFWNARTGQKYRDVRLDAWYRLNKSGTWFVSQLDRQLTILNMNDGRELQMKMPEAIAEATDLAVRPDGGAVGALVPENSNLPAKIIVLSLPELKIMHELQVEFRNERPTTVYFSPRGNFVGCERAKVGALWDLRGNTANAIAGADGMANGSGVVFSPNEKFVAILKRGRAAPAPAEWILYGQDRIDGGTDLANGKAVFSYDSSMFALSRELDPSARHWLFRKMDDFLARHGLALRPNVEACVMESATGRVLHRIPTGQCVGFAPNDATIWTQDMHGDSGTLKYSMRLRQWPTHAPGPSWWVWLVSAIGIGVIAIDCRRAFLRRGVRDASAKRR